jgi:hypothetical protein
MEFEIRQGVCNYLPALKMDDAEASDRYSAIDVNAMHQ